eukprot:4863195-Prymnesium_polylepis.1
MIERCGRSSRSGRMARAQASCGGRAAPGGARGRALRLRFGLRPTAGVWRGVPELGLALRARPRRYDIGDRGQSPEGISPLPLAGVTAVRPAGRLGGV